MVSKDLEKAINQQINAEFWSVYLYLSMLYHFANEGLSGVSNWFKIQFEEEQVHAFKLANYLTARGNKVKLMPLESVQTSWNSVLSAFEDTLEHESPISSFLHF